MKLFVELDMNPDIALHQQAGSIKGALITVIESAFARIPPGAQLSQILTQYPEEQVLMLAEAVHDPVDNRDPLVAAEYPVNLRIGISREDFDTTCHAKQQAERNGAADKLVLEPARLPRQRASLDPSGMTIRRS